MATKGEQFRYQQERTGPQARPWTSETRTHVRFALRHRAVGSSKHAVYVFEPSATGRPSRKSTRRSSNRMRTSMQLERAKSPEFNPVPSALRPR